MSTTTITTEPTTLAACQCGGICRPPSGMDWQPESRRFTCPKCGQTLAPGDHRLLDLMREWTQVAEPRLHHLPRWFERIVREKFRGQITPRLWRGYGVREFLRHQLDKCMDHWGSLTTRQGVRQFVLEPYVNDGTIERFQAFAAALGVDTDISPASWWYPGSTIRLAFIDPETTKRVDQR